MEWIKNRWVITILICILVITAAVLIVVLLLQPHDNNYTNAWYVKSGGGPSAGAVLPAKELECAGLARRGNSYIIQFAVLRYSCFGGCSYGA